MHHFVGLKSGFKRTIIEFILFDAQIYKIIPDYILNIEPEFIWAIRVKFQN